MTILTLADAARVLGVKNARAVRRLIRQDPTLPFARKGKRWLAVEADLEQWVRHDYEEKAKQLLAGTLVDEDAATRSAAHFLDDYLADHKSRRRHRTRRTP